MSTPSTTVDEIADGIYRLSTWIPDVAPPAGFTFNQLSVVGFVIALGLLVDDSVVVVKVTGETAEYWDTPGGLVASVLSLVEVKTTGQRYHGNENEVVEL